MQRKYSKYLVRLYKISGITVINSIVPVITWAIIGITQGDKQLATIFSVTYSMQFMLYIMLDIFVAGNLIRYKRKVGTKDAVYSGIVISTVIVALILICTRIDYFLEFMGLEDKYAVWVIYSTVNIGLSIPLIQVLELKYFNEQEKEATIITFTYNVISLVSINILSLTIRVEIAVMVSSILLLIYILYILIKNIEKFKMTFKVLGGCSYVYGSLVTNVTMFITYFFGMQLAFSYGSDFALAVSIMSMSTDIQWDVAGNSIFTVAKTEIAAGKARVGELIKSSRIFVLSLMASIIAASTILYILYKPNIQFAVCIITLELIDFLTIQTRYVKQVWVDIEIRTKQVIYVVMAVQLIRLALSVGVDSKYALWYGQLASGALTWTYYTIIYRKYKDKRELKH